MNDIWYDISAKGKTHYKSKKHSIRSVDFHQFRKEVFEFGQWGYLGFGWIWNVSSSKWAAGGQLKDWNWQKHTKPHRFCQIPCTNISDASISHVYKTVLPNIRPLFWLRKKSTKPCHLHQGLLQVWTYSRKGNRHGMAANTHVSHPRKLTPPLNRGHFNMKVLFQTHQLHSTTTFQGDMC